MTQDNNLLFYWPINRLKPTGGAPGYLYNLYQGLQSINAGGYSFLPPEGMGYEDSRLLQRVIPKRIKDIRRLNHLVNLPKENRIPPVDLSNYKTIHFHSTMDLYLCRKALESYNGAVLLTSHSPCALHKEFIARLDPQDAERYKGRLLQLERMDEFAFNRADYIFFPCEEAEEPYFHTWSNYKSVRNKTKLRYISTGILECVAKTPGLEVRERLGIPQEAFVLCYVGRHNEIKGYDRLVAQIPEILDKYGAWMLVAGKQGPLFPPRHDRWIEVGWTDDPHSLMAASDLFILPNHETFFDLVMLEVLSLGIPILASRTGGNRFFEKFGSRGISLFEDERGLARAIAEFASMGDDDRVNASQDNIRLFKSEFTCSKFAARYCNLIDEICGEALL